jgi:hypothetical protein
VTASRRPLDDAELAERLGALAPVVAWPAAPDLAARVVAALDAGEPHRRHGIRSVLASRGLGGPAGGGRTTGRALVLALVALLALAVAAAALGLGVPGIRIVTAPPATLSPSAAGPTSSAGSASAAVPAATPPPLPTLAADDLGPVVSLDAARVTAGFGVLVPTAAGYATPPEVRLRGKAPLGRVTLRYADGTLLTEFIGVIQPDAFQKIVGSGTVVTPVRVGAESGWWITGAPHELGMLFTDPSGTTWWEQFTVTGNVLVWQAGTVTLRLETPLEQAAAIAVAASLR